MSLQPVSFSKPIEHAPRLSTPRVPGKHDARFWTDEEKATIERHYPTGGVSACLAHLPAHRTPSGVYGMARKLGLSSSALVSPKSAKIDAPADIDDRLRAAWPLMSGKKRGEVNDFADGLGLPRWWVSNRARALGLVMPHRKEPPWTAAEEALLGKVPLLDLDKCAEIFREHGFKRSPTAINIRCKRKGLSRRATRTTFSATEVSKILGVDGKSVTREILAGDLVATKRADKRLPQQGGASWDITPAALRTYVIDHLERVDFRKVDKFELVALLTGPDRGVQA